MENFAERPAMQKAQQLREHGIYPFFRSIEDSEGSRVMVDGREMVMIGSNNYLGLTHHPYVINKAKEALDKYGSGCTGSRFLNGNLTIHEELEDRLAKFTGKESALCFSTGMQVNLGSIPSICGPRDCMFNDMENHASIIDGCRLSLGDNFKFKHKDYDNLEELLEANKDKYKNKVIISDGVFSMNGHIADVPRLAKLAKKYDALVYIDDAHGIGVMGPHGSGTVAHFGATEDVDLIMGTFSKSFASIGGFVAGSHAHVQWIKHTARSFMFSASMSPASVASALASLDIMESDNQIFDKLWANVSFMRKGFKKLGLYTYDSQTPIIPVLVGDDMKAFQVTRFLYDHGVFATPVISPAVPKGEALIRTSYMPSHKQEDLSYVLDVFKKTNEQFNLPTVN